MRKFIIFLYMLLIPLSLASCKEDKPKVPKSYYMEFNTYEDLKEYLNTYHNVDPFLPEFDVEGIIKYEYVLSGTCQCLEATEDEAAHDGSHTFLCPNYVLENNYVYCYTKENKCFMIESKDNFIREKMIRQTVSKTTDYGDSYTAKITDSVKIYFNAVDNSNNVDYIVSKNKGVFTRQEAVDWYTNVCETLEYDPLDDVDDKNDELDDEEKVWRVVRNKIRYSYEDFTELIVIEQDNYGDKPYFDYKIPNYKFEGVEKIVYWLLGTCLTSCCGVDDFDSQCTTFKTGDLWLFCYTEENNCFVLLFNDGKLMDGELKERESFHTTTNLNNEFNAYAALLECKSENNLNVKPKVSFCAYESVPESKKQYYKENGIDFNSEYTQEEAEYWYNIVYNTLKDYHS